MVKRTALSREEQFERVLEPWMLLLTVILVPVLILPAFMDLSSVTVRMFELFNVFVWVAFYGELFLKLVVSQDRLKTLQNNPLIVLILLSPFLVPLRVLRLVRLVPAVRLLRMQRIVRYLRPKMKQIVLNLEQIFIMVGLFVIVSGFLIWQVETHNGGTITSYDDALWWAVITITTVGYGDVIPSTPEGKVLGAIVSLAGIILFMVLVARTTAYFVESQDYRKLDKRLREVVTHVSPKGRKRL